MVSCYIAAYTRFVHVYLIGICGTGMGSLATLLKKLGHHVSGSDPSPRPPISEVLASAGINVLKGWNPENLDSTQPDLVVVGNVCRKDNPEALRAEKLGIERISMPKTVQKFLIGHRNCLVAAGTHGKTTTTALLGTILLSAGLDPTILVGGVAKNLEGSSHLGSGNMVVIEGDEYDSAFFEKIPKFWSYSPTSAIISSVEHDHLDIYPDEQSYIRAFEEFVKLIPETGVLAIWAGDPLAMALSKHAKCRVFPYALRTDPVVRGSEPKYWATLRPSKPKSNKVELLISWPDGGTSRFPTPLAGEHNARNTLAAAILCKESCGLTPGQIARGISEFKGIALRQEHRGTRKSIRVYRDFAHHPEAVAQTIRAMAQIAYPGRLVVAYEPRSATACRNLHQKEYVEAFSEADIVVLAPVARPEIPPDEKLDTAKIARELRALGIVATSTNSLSQVLDALNRRAKPGDLVLLLSNGHFGHIDRKFLEMLEQKW